MGKARQTTKRRVSTPVAPSVPSAPVAASAVAPVVSSTPASGLVSTTTAPGANTVPSTTPSVPNNVPAVQPAEEDMETEEALLNGRPVPTANPPAPKVPDNQEPTTNESEIETQTPSEPPSVEVVNTTVSSGSTATKSMNSSKASNTSGFSTGSDSKLDPESDSFDEIPGMFASVSMISEKVKTDYPITARPPSEVTMSMVR